VFIPNSFGFELFFVGCFINFGENIFESPVVFFQNCIFSTHVKRVISFQSIFEARDSEGGNRVIGVVHTHPDSPTGVFENFVSFFITAIIGCEHDIESTWFLRNEIRSLILISIGVSADNNGFSPRGNESRNIFDDNGFSEYRTVQVVSDGSVGGFPHLF